MAYEALLVDFYGTLVDEDGEIVDRIVASVCRASPRDISAGEVAFAWWEVFMRLCAEARGERFRTQRDIELASLSQIVATFEADLDAEALSEELFAYWMSPTPVKGAAEFLSDVDLPVCMVSNIDTSDIQRALDILGWNVDYVVTSELCRSYKPRPEMFNTALTLLGKAPGNVLHLGDSLMSDIQGARSIGIDAIWVNPRGRAIDVTSGLRPAHVVSTISEVIPWIKRDGDGAA